jgi:hypothetical protein
MADLNIIAELKLLFTGKGGKQADAALKKTEKQAKKTGKAMDGLSKKFGSVTAKEAERLGMAIEPTVQHATNLTEAIEKQTGILRQDTIGAFNKFLGLTGDVDQATLLLRASVQAQEGGFKDLATASNLLGSILQGEVIEPSKSLGLAFDQSREAAEQQAEVLQQAIDKMLGLEGSFTDTTDAIGRGKAGWNDFKMAIGEGFAVFATLLRYLGSVTKFLKSLGPIAVKSFFQIKGGLTGIVNVFKAIDFKALIFGDFDVAVSHLADAFAEGMRSVEFEVEGAQETLDEIWAEGGDKVLQTVEKQTEAMAGLMTEANKRDQKRIDSRLKTEGDKRKAFEAKLRRDLLAAEIAASEEGSTERLALQKQQLDLMREHAIAEAKKLGADVALVKKLFDLSDKALDAQSAKDHKELMLELEQTFIDAKKELVDAATEEALADIESGTMEEAAVRFEAMKDQFRLEADERQAEREKLLEEHKGNKDAEAKINETFRLREKAAEKRFETEKIKLAKLTAEQKKELAFTVANAAIALGRELFGESKALAVASAIVNTAEGVSKALTVGPPVGFVLAGIVAAMGAAQIAKILSTEPGGGGGGGGVAVAGASGGLSAQAAATALPERSTGPGIDDNRFDGDGGSDPDAPGVGDPAAPQAVHFHGPNIIDEASLRRFGRKIDRAKARDQTRVLP